MRLICGFVFLDDRKAEASCLQRMLAAMIEPGLAPQTAHLVEGSAALAVMDFSGVQPAISRAAGGLRLAADARLHDPFGNDEGQLLTALDTPHIEALGRVLGEFVCAAWDARSNTLTCARDGMGVRPLFFTYQPGRLFAFASVPRALHASGLVTRELDQDYLLSDLLGTPLGPQRSLFKGIERLAPGERLRVSPQGLERQYHWRLDPNVGGQHICSPQQAADELAGRVGEAVRCRLPDNGPVASHLSGGLDSSALTILAARKLRQTGQPLFSYSFLPSPIPGLDLQGEGAYVNTVLQQEQDIISQAVRIDDPAAFIFPRMDVDQLMPCDPAFHDIQVCTHAAAHGARTVLSGWGGDEGATYNGRGALAEALLSGQWRYMTTEIQALTRLSGQSALTIIRGELLRYLVPEAAWLFLRQLRGNESVTGIMQSLLNTKASFVTGPGLSIGANTVGNRWQLLSSSSHLARRTEQWALMGARHGVALAFPLLDRRVVEFAWSLPGTLFSRGGWKRRVFRDAMADVLPDEIRWRRNKLSPFPEILLIQAMHRQALLEQMEELRAHRLAGDLFDLHAIQQRIEQLPAVEDAKRMILSEDRTRMATAGRTVPMPLLRAMAWLLQHH